MTAPTTPNAALAYRVLDHIDAHPEQWNQGLYIGKAECGTVACFAGWACLLSGEEPLFSMWDPNETSWLRAGRDEFPVSERAQQLLGVSRYVEHDDQEHDDDLFGGHNTREDLGRLVAEIFGPRPAGGEGGNAPVVAGPYGVADWRAPLTDFERRAGVVAPDDVPPNAGSAS